MLFCAHTLDRARVALLTEEVNSAPTRTGSQPLRHDRCRLSTLRQVRYVSRKRLAESRPRVRGQFVKAGVTAACHALATQVPLLSSVSACLGLASREAVGAAELA